MLWIIGLIVSEILGIWLLTKIWLELYPTILRELQLELKSLKEPKFSYKTVVHKVRGFINFHLILFGLRCTGIVPDESVNADGIFHVLLLLDIVIVAAAIALTAQLWPKAPQHDYVINKVKQALTLTVSVPILVLNLLVMAVRILNYL